MSISYRALFIAAGLLATTVLPGTSSADAPMVKTQAPGFYRVMVGDFEVTAVSDGTTRLPVVELLRGEAAQTRQALRRSYLPDQVETSVNAYLVNTGSRLVLIDTGAAGLFGPTLGKLLANIRAAGYRAEQVDEIYITHMHPDHVGGLMAGSARAFPNATLRMDQRDTDFWLSEANMNAAPPASRGFFQGAMASVNPYVQAGKLRPFEGSTELLPGIRSMSAYGHTPGHTMYVVESKGDKLVLWGDLMHVAAVQFANPAVTIQFDTDSTLAAAARAQAYADAARNGYMVAGAHLAFPGIGRLQAEGPGYRFVPLNYSALP
ncbi:MAG: fold metallo-hydrolase [Ramlibacter sp.]|nr:fold metallo-hydrolase [Ramlibacter sp.]